ncbi:hypothetical protein JW930_04810 [Candidatus Woesearchaeota archaeon]|nr:hypothetical protein [Candidatus Woesearchaeota archaeon]
MSKPKAAICSLTSCAGCQSMLLNVEKALGNIFSKLDFVYFPLIKRENELKKYDFCFIEGAVTNKEQVKLIKHLRKKSRFVVAFGTCATYGGIASIQDFENETLAEEVYGSKISRISDTVQGIGNYINVDYYMRGCPVIKDELLKTIDFFEQMKIPPDYELPVCVECRKKGNRCLLAVDHLPCMGAITYGGCDALCTSQGIPCQGCRGPLPSANVDARVKVFEKFGMSKEDIRRRFIKFAGTSKKFRRILKEL